jgi:hypothetical protein
MPKIPQMRDVVIAALVMAVGLLGYLLHSMGASLADQQRQIEDLGTKPRTPGLEQQEKCANQAERAFNNGGWSGTRASYNIASHYNEKLNKCVMVVSSSESYPKQVRPPHGIILAPGNKRPTPESEVILSSTMFDAFSGEDFGIFIKKLTAAEPSECHVTLPSGEERYCHSSDEFDKFSKVYLQ